MTQRTAAGMTTMTAGREHLHRGIRATASPPVWARPFNLFMCFLGVALGGYLIGWAHAAVTFREMMQ